VALGEASAAITSDAAGADGQARHARAPVGRFVGPGYVVAFVAVTLAGVAQAMTTPGALAMPGGWRGLVLVGAAYALLGTLGLHAAERRGSRAGAPSAFSFQSGLKASQRLFCEEDHLLCLQRAYALAHSEIGTIQCAPVSRSNTAPYPNTSRSIVQGQPYDES
jgi:hypothetical protein